MKQSFIAYKVEDNWQKFDDYSFRYLDALASIFLTHSAVTATIEMEDEIYLSYSNDPLIVPDQQRLFKFIKDVVANSTNDQLLTVYLIYNVDFRKLLDDLFKFTTEKELKDQFFLLDKDIKNSIKVLNTSLQKGYEIDLDQFSSVVEKYKQLLLCKSELQDFEKFFRPIQDTYKLHYYFNELGYSKKIKDIIVLPNPHAIHADTNIVANFPDQNSLINKKYIGVSKLCCGYCHKYLDDYAFLHRGTHGVCDEKWGYPWLYKDKKSPLEEKFKQKVSLNLIEEFDIKNPPPQHRKLSLDDFEKKIHVILPNDGDSHFHTNLAEIKTCDTIEITGDIMKLCVGDC